MCCAHLSNCLDACVPHSLCSPAAMHPQYVGFIPAFSFARVDDFTWGNRGTHFAAPMLCSTETRTYYFKLTVTVAPRACTDSTASAGASATKDELEKNRIRFRNTKIKINVLIVVSPSARARDGGRGGDVH